MRASVVVPTHGRPQSLQHCLAALLEQDLDPDSYEVIVVDDAASSATRHVVERLAASNGHAVRYLPLQGGCGPAAARNAGWRVARGQIVAFTDDDCLPEQHWLRAGLGAFVDGVAGASGRILVPVSSYPTDYERNAAQLQHSTFVTANCFYRREALATAGGFDERFRVAWREDTDLFFRLRRANHRLVQVPEAVVVHPVRRVGWGISVRQQRKSMFNALLYKKHPADYRREIQPSPPWQYYQIVAALLLALRGGAFAPLGAGLWAALTARFCARRLHRTSHTPRHVAEMIVTSILIPPLAVFWRLYGAVRFRVWFL